MYFKSDGLNNYYVLGVPLDVTYQFLRGRFGLGVSIGVSPGVVINSKGNYLHKEEATTANFKNENSRQFTMNARAGIELSYLVTEHFRLLLRLTGRVYLKDIREKYGSGKQYKSIGAYIGMLYNIQ